MSEVDEYQRVSKTSLDVTHEQIAQLKQLFPECVSEGKIDFDLLRATLGEADALTKRDAYSFTWAGRKDVFRAIQSVSVASLAPRPAESVNWDSTRHVFIEGENLEVLKLLYRAYCGRVKMIYIDPPYNTGRDFIYSDDYSQPLRAYLEKTGQIDPNGNLLTSNPETNGRYHSRWLSMMYPRLFLARGLLRDDGVIFVSIDDHEVHHLRLLMNEIFGEENFVATVIWQKVFSPKNTAMYFSEDHDYIVIYARNKEAWRPNLLPRTEEADARYRNPDNDPRGPWTSSDLTARNYYAAGQYEVTGPTGKKFGPGVGRYWRSSYEKFLELDADNRIWWGEDGENMPRLKRFLSEVKRGVVPQTLWRYEDVGHTQEAKKALLEFVEFERTENVINTLKPPRLIRRMLQIGTDVDTGDIVMDFFAGSATTACAVLEQNHLDGGNRRFIMVQFPEPLPKPESRLRTIADIGKERIRNVIARLRAEEEGRLPMGGDVDLGFKVFKLAPSTFQQWEPPSEHTAEAMTRQMALFDDGLKPDADPFHVLYEVLVKEGYRLDSRVEELSLERNTVYRVSQPDEEDDFIYVCLDEAVRSDVIDALSLDKETVFICRDTALDDSTKVNLFLHCLLKVI